MLTPEQIEVNWNCLMDILPINLRPLFDMYKHSHLLEDGDKHVRVFGIYDAPAGKGVHHAYQGGLVVHLLEMKYYLDCFTHCLDGPSGGPHPDLDLEAMYEGAFLHDIHKGFMHFYEKEDGTLDYWNGAWSAFMTPDQKTYAMLMEAGVKISPKVQHIVNNSEGGWAENPSKEVTVEAKLAYLADELSVVNSRLQQGNSKSIRQRPDVWHKFSPF